AVGRVAFTANGRQLVSISPNQKFGTARLWDALTGQYLAMLPDKWSWTDGGVLCPSGDGTTLLLGDFNDITVWDVRARRTVRRIPIGKKSAPTATHQILALALSPDGRRRTSISEDGSGRMTFLVSEVSSGAEVHRREVVLTDRRISPLALAPDGRLAATTDGRAVWVRDVVSGAIRQTLHIAKPEGGETLWGRLTFSND